VLVENRFDASPKDGTQLNSRNFIQELGDVGLCPSGGDSGSTTCVYLRFRYHNTKVMRKARPASPVITAPAITPAPVE
jgi:hypothetical protein